ncbi:MAG: hypothetical protein WBM04_18410 [Candidatus Korobacteraceae bacterium]
MGTGTKFCEGIGKLLKQQLSAPDLEGITTRDDSYIEVVRKGLPNRLVIINFKGDAGFIHFGAVGGIEGPFAYANDGTIITRSRDNKRFTPQEMTEEILAYLRSGSSVGEPI